MSRICLNCNKPGMTKDRRAVMARYDGFCKTVPDVKGWHCPHCGEVEFLDTESSERFEQALDTLAQQQRIWLRETRRKLRLTQAEAARITGGGINAFSRYERGEARPVAAVINLFRMLDKHPELLSEVREPTPL